MKAQWTTNSAEDTKKLAETIGRSLVGGEVFVFKSDLGGGKTTLVSGLVKGFGSSDPVASPTFVISSVYSRNDKKEFHHFDFYRLDEPGVIAQELSEVVDQEDTVVAIEWGDTVSNVLPSSAIVVSIVNNPNDSRTFTFEYDDKFAYLFAGIKA